MQQIKEPFSLLKARSLYENGKLKDHLDCKKYINKYFYSANDGTVFMYEIEPFTHGTDKRTRAEWTIYDSNELTKKLNKIIEIKEGSTKMNNSLSVWFLNQPIERRFGMDIMKPFLYTENSIEYLNLAKPFLHTRKPYNDYNEKSKAGVKIFLDYIKEVLASDNEDQYNYLIKWLANMIQGNKNDALIYLKGQQGIGKSTLTDFLCEFVLGWDISLISGSDPLKSSFNKCLMGKLLVVFEELETFSDKDWAGVSVVLKRNITGIKAQYSDKYEKTITADNINNYIVNTNTEALKDSDGRRIYICDVSTKRMKDHVYFGNIKNNCYNYEVGEAFFSYLNEINVKGFMAQEYPETEAKRMACSERLDIEYKFLKFQYVLTNHSIIAKKQGDLYKEYCDYCCSIKKNYVSNKQFYKKLRDIQIESRKTNGEFYYNVSIDDLKKIADKHAWIDKYDEEIKDDDGALYDEDTNNIKQQNEVLVKENKVLFSENEELKKEIERLKELLNQNKKEEIVIEEVKPIIEPIDNKEVEIEIIEEDIVIDEPPKIKKTRTKTTTDKPKQTRTKKVIETTDDKKIKSCKELFKNKSNIIKNMVEVDNFKL